MWKALRLQLNFDSVLWSFSIRTSHTSERRKVLWWHGARQYLCAHMWTGRCACIHTYTSKSTLIFSTSFFFFFHSQLLKGGVWGRYWEAWWNYGCLMQRHVRSSAAYYNNGSSRKVISQFLPRGINSAGNQTDPRHSAPSPSVRIGQVVFVVRPIWTAGVVLHGCMYLIID